MKLSNEMLTRAKQLGMELARSFLNAVVWRAAHRMPLVWLVILAALAFLAIVVLG